MAVPEREAAAPKRATSPSEPDKLPSYLSTALRPVHIAVPPPLMSAVQPDGSRALFSTNALHDRQRYLVANRTRDIFRTAIVHVPLAKGVALVPPDERAAQADFLNACDGALRVEKEFGTPRRYGIFSATPYGHGDGALVRLVMSSIRDVWNVENTGLFADLEEGVVVGKIHCLASVSSLFMFVPAKGVLPGVPRLEMQPAHSNGFGGYKLCVADVPQPVGTVRVERYYYDLEVFHCTREEAILWVCIIVGAELEKRSPLVQFYTRE